MSGATITGSLTDSLVGFARDLPTEMVSFGFANTDNLQHEIEAETPVDTGNLARSYYVVGPRVTTNTLTWKVKTDVKYAPWVEWDTGIHGPGRKYKIAARRASHLHFFWEKKGVMVTTKYVWHPGSKGAHMFAKGADSVERVLPGRMSLKLRELAWKHGFRYNGVVPR
jgi:hypothetical protein